MFMISSFHIFHVYQGRKKCKKQIDSGCYLTNLSDPRQKISFYFYFYSNLDCRKSAYNASEAITVKNNGEAWSF